MNLPKLAHASLSAVVVGGVSLYLSVLWLKGAALVVRDQWREFVG